jgi:hypothetical protein
MNAKQIGLSLVLADFLALTAYALYQYGYVGFFEVAFSNAVGIQLLTDLVIALSFFISWMIPDARARGISPAPYLVLVVTLGSIGALAYLIRRSWSEQPSSVRVAATSAVRG